MFPRYRVRVRVSEGLFDPNLIGGLIWADRVLIWATQDCGNLGLSENKTLGTWDPVNIDILLYWSTAFKPGSLLMSKYRPRSTISHSEHLNTNMTNMFISSDKYCLLDQLLLAFSLPESRSSLVGKSSWSFRRLAEWWHPKLAFNAWWQIRLIGPSLTKENETFWLFSWTLLHIVFLANNGLAQRKLHDNIAIQVIRQEHFNNGLITYNCQCPLSSTMTH